MGIGLNGSISIVNSRIAAVFTDNDHLEGGDDDFDY